MSGKAPKVEVGRAAPDIVAPDWQGNRFRLGDLRGKQNVILVLNRGFICPFCRRHMARLHASRDAIRERDAQVVIIGPDSAEAFGRHWESGGLDFIGIPDPERRLLRRYGQEVRLMRLGRLPATVVLDKEGIVRHVHYGGSMMDIPPVEDILSVLDGIRTSKL